MRLRYLLALGQDFVEDLGTGSKCLKTQCVREMKNALVVSVVTSATAVSWELDVQLQHLCV